jgi:polyisoprenoid-binding protein YceI
MTDKEKTMKQRFLPLALLLCLLLPAGSWAAAQEWDLDRAHSNIYFDITHIFSTTRGHFEDFSTSFAFDPDNLEQSRIEFTVDCESVNTHIPKRDQHLRSDDFFHVAEHPEMTFKSSEILHLRDNDYEVTGDLTLKGRTRTVTVPFVFYGVTDSPLQKNVRVAGFDARFSLDRLAYGVGDGRFYDLGVVGKDVQVFVSLEMVREK